jgi:hypothetical protein
LIIRTRCCRAHCYWIRSQRIELETRDFSASALVLIPIRPGTANGSIRRVAVSVDNPVRRDTRRHHTHGRTTLVDDNPCWFQHTARKFQPDHENIAANFQILRHAAFPCSAGIVDDLP